MLRRGRGHSRQLLPLVVVLLTAATSLSVHGQHGAVASDSAVDGMADWLLPGGRVLLGDDSEGGGPTNKEVSRQRRMSTSQADTESSDVLLKQQARGVVDSSMSGHRRKGYRGNTDSRPSPAGAVTPLPAARRRKGGGPSLCGNGMCDKGENCATCPRDCTKPNGDACGRVGIQYSVWHWPAWNAMQVRSQQMAGGPMSVEAVLRSQVPGGRNASFSDLLYGPDLTALAMNFHWQHLPEYNAGPYCIYHRRKKGDVNYNAMHEGAYQGFYNQPDCPGYRGTLARHAQQLVAAGIDHVLVDMTNMPFYSPTADAIQLRPFEVLVEEWAALRAQGIQTPDIAAWQRLPDSGLPPEDVKPGKLMWKYVLRLYNTRKYQHMWLRDPATDHKIFAYPAVPGIEPAHVKAVEKNWGMNNVVAQPMWISHEDEWAFMSLCQELAFITNDACSQSHSKPVAGKGVGGTQLAVSPSYQLSYSSAAFAAVGTWAGHTLRKQFATAFQLQPQWLFLSSWNEHVAQPMPDSTGKAMGFSGDPTIGMFGFVDTYASAFGRDIEPTLEDGSLLYDITTSCLRVYRSHTPACDDHPKELCCNGGRWGDSFAYMTLNGLILGLYANTVRPDKGRAPLYNCSSIPTPPPPPLRPAPAARAAASDRGRRLHAADHVTSQAAGSAAAALRYAASGSSRFADAAAGSGGAGGGRRLAGTAEVGEVEVGRQLSPWFLSTDAKCEASGLLATRVGYIATWKGRDFLRTLTRCVGPGEDRTQYTMGNGCVLAGYTPEKALGYVR